MAEAVRRVETHGGKILTKPFRIDRVGELVLVQDGEGDRIGAMRDDRAFSTGRCPPRLAFLIDWLQKRTEIPAAARNDRRRKM